MTDKWFSQNSQQQQKKNKEDLARWFSYHSERNTRITCWIWYV